MEQQVNPGNGFIAALRRNTVPLLLSVIAALGVVLFLFFFYGYATEIGPEQPIPFSHQVHSGVKQIQCRYCHPYVGYSNHPGLPPVGKCLHCHNYISANHPWIREEHRYFDTETPTPWKKVFYAPEHVLFNHQRHIRKDIACQKCHGAVETMHRLESHRFKMGFCVDCHREQQANLDCWLACHS
jgi:hypothetical protein